MERASGEPLLESQNSLKGVTTTTSAIPMLFMIIGLASSVLWNQLMLSVGYLVELFGDSSLASAASAQNVFCAVAMGVFTLFPKLSLGFRVQACVLANIVMMIVGSSLSWGSFEKAHNQAHFLAAVSLNGICTGIAQNMAASISGSYPGGAGALLLGESLAPAVTVVIHVLVSTLGLSTPAATAVSLCIAQFVLLAAVVCLFRLRSISPTEPAKDTLVACCDGGDATEELAMKRLAELMGNSLVAFLACFMWCFVLCSSPYIADGLCSGDANCKAQLPTTMLGMANIAAVGGRALGMIRTKSTTTRIRLLFQTLLQGVAGFALVWFCVKGSGEAAVMFPFVIGITVSVSLTVYSNVLLMWNDQNAQASCCHSGMAPCALTTQLLWLAIQTGSIGGTFVSRIWT
jgi:hypothetical protein|eukprot:TRINITY_DN3270_c1_g2_i1.p1 TRINITY_DN3270_c1_g2~~TRINITY_DN3270_c1_g2_i1.p1  ORF type:complete len:403 (-),score=45.75 TRINITY_DN3270_c1_g2_i1:182-1390(-)